jgi:glycosyltransferase involved in cell wall biosynthesis
MSRPPQDARPRVLAVATFPPPVHGMSTAVERLVGELERTAEVRRVNIGAPTLTRSPGYHLTRIRRVVAAVGVVVRERSRTRTAFFSCDAGPGMVYTAVLTTVARGLGYDLHLQYHSYRYITDRSALLAAIVTVLGARCEHLLTCPRMQADFVARYPGARTRVVGVAQGIEVADGARRRPAGPCLVLGFLGNVTIDKGVGVAVATARAAAAAGVPVELRIAGPVIEPAAEQLVAEAVADGGTPVTALGALGPGERDRFLDDLDVFLFPTRYVHESFGLVAWEAMARGVPVLARRAGCLTAAAVGDGGVVLDAGADAVDDEVALAVGVLRRWWDDPAGLALAGAAARRRAAVEVATSQRQVEQFRDDLTGRSAPLPASRQEIVS